MQDRPVSGGLISEEDFLKSGNCRKTVLYFIGIMDIAGNEKFYSKEGVKDVKRT